MSDYDVLAVIEEKKASQDDCGNVSVSVEIGRASCRERVCLYV